MTASAEDIAHWQTWVGREELREERLDAEGLRRFAAAIGEGLDVEARQPSLAHWAFFLPVVGPDQIGPDGHPKRGGFLPPISLPRRMFASAEMDFPEPLVIDAPARRVSRVVDLAHKAGRSGELVLVQVEHRIEQEGRLRVSERQTIVYRDAGGATPAIVPAEQAPEGVAWAPTPVDLFRFSAVTFNSHRIHYDLAYATAEEGYPGLVVHGPFTAAKLFGHAAREGRRPMGFSFRAVAPIFCGKPVALADGDAEGQVRAVRCDGVTAMEAAARF